RAIRSAHALRGVGTFRPSRHRINRATMTFATSPTQPALPNGQPLRFTLVRIDSNMCIAEEWRTLEQAADCSFFISWSWIGPWLDMALRADTELYLYRCLEADQTVALAILSRTKVTRKKIFR